MKNQNWQEAIVWAFGCLGSRDVPRSRVSSRVLLARDFSIYPLKEEHTRMLLHTFMG